jgi:hypothetical protein
MSYTTMLLSMEEGENLVYEGEIHVERYRGGGNMVRYNG